MACETPVLASATGPVEEVITDGENGFLFDYFDEDQLVARVEELMEDPQRRKAVGERGRQHIVEHYDLERRCLPQHIALIDSLVAK